MRANSGIAISSFLGILLAQTITIPALLAATASGNTVSAVASGSWSSPSTWSSGRVPAEGDAVVIPAGKSLAYDANSTATLHTLTILGSLQFSNQISTRLRAGLIKIGADARDNSANCAGSMPGAPAPGTLIVGLPGAPIPHGVTATIQLVPFSGQNAADAPGLINCGGRLNLQGATLNYPWTRLTANATAGTTTLSVVDDLADWRVGDSIIVVGTNNGKSNFSDGPPSYRTNPQLVQTEQRTITAVSGRTVTLSSPLTYTHDNIAGNYPEVANLTRTVVVESTDISSAGTRGHTMYHAHSSGSVAYARFEGLGKEANLGRYPVHLHMVGDTMRGFSAIGNVVTNSDNKFYTIHGSDYALLRDNIGWRANTSGFFLEDGSEVYNVLDHNLAVNALNGTPAPSEHLSYLTGKGYGYWWANGRNTLINNQAAENDSFAYFYESNKVAYYYGATYSSPQHLIAPMLDETGTRVNTTIHSVPFFRFDRNSCHNEHHWCFSAIGGAWTASRPSVITSFNAWTTHYPFTIASDGVLIDGLKSNNSNYGPDLKPNYNNNRSWVSDITFNALQVERAGVTGMGLIAAGTNVSIIDARLSNVAAIWLPNNTYNVTPTVTFVRLNESYSGGFLGAKSATEVSSGTTGMTYLNDWYGPGTAAKVIRADRTLNDGLTYGQDPNLVLPQAKAASTGNVGYTPLSPIDDLAPATAITSLGSLQDGLPVVLPGNGQLVLTGTTTDNGSVARVWVNGIPATPLKADYSQWQVTLPGLVPGAYTVTAYGQDAVGNIERNPHVLTLNLVSPTGASRR